MAAAAEVVDQFSDVRWRLNNLYWIVNEDGREVPFRLRPAQERLLNDLHTLNVILKARQPGITTFVQIYMLDACVFYPNLAAGVIAHNKDDAQAFFRNKVKFPYERLPDGIKRCNEAVQDAADSLAFANGSSIRVGTSLRSGTLQMLHISEYGKLCAKYPEKAREVRTGALNTVHKGQEIFIESTAEGQAGHFYELCQQAQSLQRRGADLTELDFKFHFFPWHEDPKYVLNEDVPIPQEMSEYFEGLGAKGIALTPDQQRWYAKKAEQQGDDMKREFPATPEEAFEASIEGAYYARQFMLLDQRRQIGKVLHDPSLPVETWWDLGANDQTVIWFVQRIGRNFAVIDIHANSGEGLGYYAGVLQERQQKRGYVYSEHLWPHDGGSKILDERGRTRLEVMNDLGYAPRVIKRNPSIQAGIEAVRNILPRCWFDEENCAEGLKALRAYRKEWDENRATWKDRPYHDWASDYADAFRTGCEDTAAEELELEDEWRRQSEEGGRSRLGGY